MKNNKVFPIYLLNTNVFFKTKLFTKKVFSFNSAIVVIIGRLVESYFSNQFSSDVHNSIDLSIITKFVEETNYMIKKIFINKSNMCYYVHLKTASGKNRKCIRSGVPFILFKYQ